MKQCLNCSAQYSIDHDSCNNCGAKPSNIDGFDSYAPEFAKMGGGFKADYFSDLMRLEQENFWFKARNKIILWALKKFAPNSKNFLEIGCGTGFVLTGIQQYFTTTTLSGSEIFTQGLSFAKQRLPAVNLMQMDARQIPFINEFDVIGAFDVLEHIHEDELVLGQINKALTPNGIVIISVPQHQWLWSASDDYACHVRRYTASEIHLKLKKAGFTTICSTSFVTSLLPAMMFSRLVKKQSLDDFNPEAELKVHPILNKVFEYLLGIELLAIKLGFRLPLGGSRLVLAKKQSNLF